MNRYMSGSLVRSKAVFQNISGVIDDPTTIVLRYKSGSGAVTTLTYPTGIQRETQGVYHYDVDTTGWAGPGDLDYIAQWTGTGNVIAIEPDEWEVYPPAL